MTSAARTEYREEVLARVPRGYSPFLHLVLPSILALAAMDAAISLVHGLRWWQATLVPVFAGVLNGLEWHAHRGLLHRPVRSLETIYRHHLQHHTMYVKGDIAMRDPREIKVVLLPVAAILAIFAVALPVALLFLFAGQRNLALLWAATSVGYVMVYEWMHLGWHLPEDGLAARLPVLRNLRRLHELHHDPKLMHRYNLNVTVPLWDSLQGTLRRPSSASRRRA
jgi:fatty acid hydroxylase family protein